MPFDPMTEIKGVDSPTTNQWVAATGSNSPVSRDWNLDTAIREGYKSHAWAYVCGHILSENLSRLPWETFEKTSSGDMQIIPNEPRAALVENPNKHQTRAFQMAMRCLHLLLGGLSYDKLVFTGPQSKQVPSEIWSMKPDTVGVVPSDDEWISHYRVTPKKGGPENLDPKAVIQAQFVDPSDPFGGMSPLRAVGADVDMDKAATESNRNLAENAMTPTGIYSSELIKSEEDAKKVLKMLRLKSGPESSGDPLVAGFGANYKEIGLKPRDLNYLEMTKVSLQRVCSAFGLMPQRFVMEGSGLNSGFLKDAIRYEWAVGTMNVAMKISAALSKGLLTREEMLAGMRIRPDTSGIPEMRENVHDTTKSFALMVQNGVPPNVAASYLGMSLGDIPNGDVAYRATNVLPVAGGKD